MNHYRCIGKWELDTPRGARGRVFRALVWAGRDRVLSAESESAIAAAEALMAGR